MSVGGFATVGMAKLVPIPWPRITVSQEPKDVAGSTGDAVWSEGLATVGVVKWPESVVPQEP